MFFVNFVVPFVLLGIRKLRSITTGVIASFGILLGMFLERYIIVVPTLSTPRLPAATSLSYMPSWVEVGITAATFAAMIFLYLIFAKLFPSERFTVYLFAGMVPWNYLACSLNDCSMSIITNEGLIRKIYLPKLIFPLTRVLINLATFVLSLRAARHVLPYVLFHHERWDGSGYPRGLRGDLIPLAARMFAVVDTWDALRAEKPYRAAWSDAAALSYLQANAGTQFDPGIVNLFVRQEK